MTTLRVALHRGTVVAIAIWSLLLLVNEMFKGGSVGNPILCATDPRCGEGRYSVVATVAWVGGTLLVLVLGYVFRPVRGPETTTRDKVVSFRRGSRHPRAGRSGHHAVSGQPTGLTLAWGVEWGNAPCPSMCASMG